MYQRKASLQPTSFLDPYRTRNRRKPYRNDNTRTLSSVRKSRKSSTTRSNHFPKRPHGTFRLRSTTRVSSKSASNSNRRKMTPRTMLFPFRPKRRRSNNSVNPSVTTYQTRRLTKAYHTTYRSKSTSSTSTSMNRRNSNHIF